MFFPPFIEKIQLSKEFVLSFLFFWSTKSSLIQSPKSFTENLPWFFHHMIKDLIEFGNPADKQILLCHSFHREEHFHFPKTVNIWNPSQGVSFLGCAADKGFRSFFFTFTLSLRSFQKRNFSISTTVTTTFYSAFFSVQFYFCSELFGFSRILWVSKNRLNYWSFFLLFWP